jgi:nucleotide-binding universal stress UspA family protein
MTRFTQILCPVDLSEPAHDALLYAASLAVQYEAALTILEVSWAGLPPIAYPAAAEHRVTFVLPPETREAYLSELKHFAGPLPLQAPGVRFVIREGAIVPEILAEAQASSTDLIVMATHGRGGFERFLLGSITEKILRKAACPVMTVPPREVAQSQERLRESTQSARLPASVFRTIVCAVDFSVASDRAIQTALSLAQQSASKLVLVHVIDLPRDAAPPRGTGPDISRQRRDAQDRALVELKAAVPAEARDWATIDEQVRVGRPYEEILRESIDRHADLIVMGVHSRPAFTFGFLGSTTDHVVREAVCPVLTVR